MKRECRIPCLMILITIFLTSQAAFAGIKDSLLAIKSDPIGTAKSTAKSVLTGGLTALGSPLGSQLAKINIEQSARDFGTKAFSAGNQALGAAISNPVGTAKIAAKSALVGGASLAKSALVGSAIALGKPVFASQLAKTNIGQRFSDFGTKALSSLQGIGTKISKNFTSFTDSVMPTGGGLDYNFFGYITTNNGGVGVSSPNVGSAVTIAGKNSSTTIARTNYLTNNRQSKNNFGNGAF